MLHFFRTAGRVLFSALRVPYTSQKGFSLLELSVVIVIIALVISMAMTSGVAVVSSARTAATHKKMAAIEQALLQYRTTNGRLPCPGDITLVPGSANYGLEAGAGTGSPVAVGAGACTGGGILPSANFTGTGVTNTGKVAAEGSLPARTIGLPVDFMIDGWGNRIRYAVDVDVTAKDVFTTTPLRCTVGAITVKDGYSNTRSTSAIYALISHGSNGRGAYTGSSSSVSRGSVNSLEQMNCHCDATGATTTSSGVQTTNPATYVQADEILNPANVLDSFDDIVTYKERWQMQVPFESTASCTPDIYIPDSAGGVGYMVRKVAGSTAIISQYAGDGNWGNAGDGGAATAATMEGPFSVAIDGQGNVYVAELFSCIIRKITASTGVISTVAGVAGSCEYSGDGGAATSAKFVEPFSIAVDSSGNLYVADIGTDSVSGLGNVVRKIAAGTGIISTVAGTGNQGYTGDGGLAVNATFMHPWSIAVDSAGNLYIADSNNVIRKVNAADGIISTVAGGGVGGDGSVATAADLHDPVGIAVDSNSNLYITSYDNKIRKVTAATGLIATIAGTGTAGYSGNGGTATSAQLNEPGRVVIDSGGNLYFNDGGNFVIRKIAASSGIISTVAGNHTQGLTGNDGAATSAQLAGPHEIGLYTASR